MAFSSVREFIPFFPLYPLLFVDTGLSTAQVSSLFVIWSATAFLLEVPSGALADLVPRRLLLVLSSLLYAGCFAVWALVPSYPAFALGFVLWGVSSAINSGTYESYVYDVLDLAGEKHRFPKVLARSRAGSLVMIMLGIPAASVLYPLGGYELVGAASVGACLLQFAIGCTLPRDPRPPREDGGSETFSWTGYLAMLREGVGEVRRSTTVRRTVIMIAVLAGIMCYDEYFPLLGAELGAGRQLVPLLLVGTVAGQAVGSLLAERVPTRLLTRAVPAAGILVIAGVLSGHPIIGFAAIAVGYGLHQMVYVASEIRLQELITGRARATVTSISGLLAELSALTVFVAFGVGSNWIGIPGLVAALAVCLVVLTPLVRRWVRACRVPKSTWDSLT